MARIDLVDIEKRFGDVTAVDTTNLTLAEGSLTAIVGPSGCGKTTLLRLVAGLERPTRGRIQIDGSDITDLPPERRALGMMFQSYALLPHMTVQENVRFPLRMQRLGSRHEQAEKVTWALDLVQLHGLESRFPKQLSGGQQQRVALARALIASPRVVLLDEPLSNLDAQLRKDMQLELIELHRKLGLTTLLVTHDQEEALSLADTVVLLRAGRVEQIGTPRAIYRRPATAFAAEFIGAANLIEVTARRAADGTWSAALKDQPSFEVPEPADGTEGERVLAVRQEDIALAAASRQTHGRTGILGTVAYQGATCRAVVTIGAQTVHVIASTTTLEALAPGSAVEVSWPVESATLL